MAFCQIPEFLSSREQEEEGWASSLSDITPAINLCEAFQEGGWLTLPSTLPCPSVSGTCLVADVTVSTLLTYPLVTSAGYWGDWLEVAFKAGLISLHEHFKLREVEVEEGQYPGEV